MVEYLFTCPACNKTVSLGSLQPNRKVCPACKVKIEQQRLLDEHQKHRETYKKQRDDLLVPAERPLTETQLTDALFDVRIKEGLNQCKKCRYSSGKGSTLTCDYIAYTGHSRSRGSGPGDCRSFEPISGGKKIDRRKPVAF